MNKEVYHQHLKEKLEESEEARKTKGTENTVTEIKGDVTKAINESLLKATKNTVSTERKMHLTSKFLI